MSLTEHYRESEETHPIDLVESLAEQYAWAFDRVAENEIALSVEGQWRTYAITLAWSDYEETLRMVCSFEMDPPKSGLPALYECLNTVNDRIWSGSFSYWATQKLMVYKYGLMLPHGHMVSFEHMNRMIGAAVIDAERFYPAFQLVAYGNHSIDDALKVAIAEAHGHA